MSESFDILSMMNVKVPDAPTPRPVPTRPSNASCKIIRPVESRNPRTPKPASKPKPAPVRAPAPAPEPAPPAASPKPATPSKRFADPQFVTSNQLDAMKPQEKAEYLDYLRARKAAQAKPEEETPDPPKPYLWCDDCLSSLMQKRREDLRRRQRELDKQAVQKQLADEKARLEQEIAKQKAAREKAIALRQQTEAEQRAHLEQRKKEIEEANQVERERLQRISSQSHLLAAEERQKRREEIQKAMRECLDAKRERLERERLDDLARDAASHPLPITGLVVNPADAERDRERARAELEAQIAARRDRERGSRAEELASERAAAQSGREAQLREIEAARRAAEDRARALRGAWDQQISGQRGRLEAEREAEREAYVATLKRNHELDAVEAQRAADAKTTMRDRLSGDLQKQLKEASVERELMNFIEKEASSQLYRDIARRHGPGCSCAICARCGRTVRKNQLNMITKVHAEELEGAE